VTTPTFLTQGQAFLSINELFILGNEIIEVLRVRGGVVPIESLLGAYKSMTAKNLDPTLFGFKSVESLLSGLEVFVTVRGRNVMLRDLENQFRDRERVSVSSRPDLIAGTRENETRDVTRDCRVSLYQLATCHVPTGSVVSPALRSVRQETMFKTSKLRLTNCLNDKSSTRLSCESKEEMLDQEKCFNECNSKRDREFFKIDLTLYLLSYHEMVNTCLNLHFLNVYEHSRIKK